MLKKASNEEKKYNVFKVPHHGSKTSFNRNLWEGVLANPYKDQILKLTCWKKGSEYLPKRNIIECMMEITENIFCTGIPERKTVKISNSTKKYYNNPNLKFSVANHKYGSISINYNKTLKKLDLNLNTPAIHVSELFT